MAKLKLLCFLFACLASVGAGAAPAFPAGPPPDAATAVWNRYGDLFKVSLWRQSGAIWLDVVRGRTLFLCSGSFSVVQGGNQYGLDLISPTGDSFCDNLLVEHQIFMLTPKRYGATFDPVGALSLAFKDGSLPQSLEVAAGQPADAITPDTTPEINLRALNVIRATCQVGRKRVVAKLDAASGSARCEGLPYKPEKLVKITITARP